MQITDLSEGMACSQKMTAQQYDMDGAQKEISKSVLMENLLDVYINEQLVMQMVCTACQLPALIVGHLYSEGMIESIDEIERIYVCGNGTTGKVFLKHSYERKSPVLEVRACDCGADGVMGRNMLPMRQTEGKQQPWKKEWAFQLIREFAQESPLHEQTHGTHSAYLSVKGTLLYKMEDIGRHNALDKAIGSALLDGIDLTQCMLLTSGRVPVDMIQKVIRSKIPVLISNAVPTDRALQLAKAYGVTLLTSARQEHMDEYSVNF